eukprot:TRINITY_DN7257_c0_g1_i1.p1 TRINITY_DN7257_c0_g1~~TRINITY_DN7257_c0_g1_i1.p1  ORF type:complete len:201 (+),score=24.71 TRINITY_DN7257_c0_g1_i1:81-683(+)
MNENGRCMPGGQCLYNTCSCIPGYPGCLPAGKCVPHEDGQPTCSCYPPNSGPHCECPVTCVHGVCNTATRSCDCENGWSGATCSVYSGPTIPSSPTIIPSPGVFPTSSCTASCGPHGKCNELTGVCVCDAGWKGPTCSEISTNHTNNNFYIFLGVGAGLVLFVIMLIFGVWCFRRFRSKKVHIEDDDPGLLEENFDAHQL